MATRSYFHDVTNDDMNEPSLLEFVQCYLDVDDAIANITCASIITSRSTTVQRYIYCFSADEDVDEDEDEDVDVDEDDIALYRVMVNWCNELCVECWEAGLFGDAVPSVDYEVTDDGRRKYRAYCPSD